MAQCTLPLDNDDVRMLRLISPHDLVLNLPGLKPRTQDIHSNAVPGALKQSSLTRGHECGLQASPFQSFDEKNRGGSLANRAIGTEYGNDRRFDLKDGPSEKMQILSWWRLSDIVDLDTIGLRLLHELLIFGEELRESIDNVHALCHGGKDRSSLLLGDE